MGHYRILQSLPIITDRLGYCLIFHALQNFFSGEKKENNLTLS